MKECKCKCKCKFTESLKESSTAVWLFAICSFLLGIIVGFMASPIKKGISIGNNNVCNNSETLPYYGDDNDEDEIEF